MSVANYKFILVVVSLFFTNTTKSCGNDFFSSLGPIGPILKPFGAVGNVLSGSISPLIGAIKKIPSLFENGQTAPANQTELVNNVTKNAADSADTLEDPEENFNSGDEETSADVDANPEDKVQKNNIKDVKEDTTANRPPPRKLLATQVIPQTAPQVVTPPEPTEEGLLTEAVSTSINSLPNDPKTVSYVISFVKSSSKGYLKYNKSKYQLYYLPTQKNTSKTKGFDYQFEQYIELNTGVPTSQGTPMNQIFLKVEKSENKKVVFSYTQDCGATDLLRFTSVSSTDIFSDVNNFYTDLGVKSSTSFSDNVRLYFHIPQYILGKNNIQNNLVLNTFPKNNYQSATLGFTQSSKRLPGNLTLSGTSFFANDVELIKRPPQYCTCCLVSNGNASNMGTSCSPPTQTNCEIIRSRFSGEVITEATKKISHTKIRELPYACSVGNKLAGCTGSTEEGTFSPEKKNKTSFDESYILVDTFLESYLPTNWTSITKLTSHNNGKLEIVTGSANILTKKN